MKYYLISGEASGDLHGSYLIAALKKLDPKAEFRAWGGDLMEKEGAMLVKHFKDLAFMGFWEVVRHLPTILNNIRYCKQDILLFQPDVIIYIDYPGFNLRIAEWAKTQNFKNHYYISPQVWAWKENRVQKIKQCIDALYVILPFEKPFFEEKHQFKVDYVGHPLMDYIPNHPKKKDFISSHHLEENKPIIALLPGSRIQEIRKMLPLYVQLAGKFKYHQFAIALYSLKLQCKPMDLQNRYAREISLYLDLHYKKHHRFSVSMWLKPWATSLLLGLYLNR